MKNYLLPSFLGQLDILVATAVDLSGSTLSLFIN